MKIKCMIPAPSAPHLVKLYAGKSYRDSLSSVVYVPVLGLAVVEHESGDRIEPVFSDENCMPIVFSQYEQQHSKDNEYVAYEMEEGECE